MKNYTNITDIKNIPKTIKNALKLKKNPYKDKNIGKNKTLVMLFFNASLRTRLSTEKAAKNLGMHVTTLNVNDAWNLTFENGSVMNLNSPEHIKEAAQVISQYADIIGIRAFANLKNKQKDYSEYVLNSFLKYATVPIINMESATMHPLQALTDAITIEELKDKANPKVVLSWAPHVKALPHAVANSFVQIMQKSNVEFSITCPKEYTLDPRITKDTPVIHDQEKALKNADFIYVKNWSSYTNYGKITPQKKDWILKKHKIKKAKLMHCLPVRRNVVISDDALDSKNAIIIEQANNRTFAAQIILKKILKNI